MVEFTLVGIPLIFMMISIFEIARGMWIYETLAHTVREGTRYAVVHGNTCTFAPHTCVATLGSLTTYMRNIGAGLVPDDLTITIASSTRTYGPVKLSTLLTNTTPFPSFAVGTKPVDGGGETEQPITITATYPFRSAICMFWPGAGGTGVFSAINLPATSRAYIQF
jgi:Flp pilus assembly protein TadG